MLHQLANHMTEVKLTIATIIGAAAWVADASTALDAKGWEELGLKGILLAALMFVGKLFLDANKTHKEEIEKAWETHKAELKANVEKQALESREREQKLIGAITSNTDVLNNVAQLTKEQTEWYRATAKVMLEERIKPKLP